jgi:hypothetical protein
MTKKTETKTVDALETYEAIQDLAEAASRRLGWEQRYDGTKPPVLAEGLVWDPEDGEWTSDFYADVDAEIVVITDRDSHIDAAIEANKTVRLDEPDALTKAEALIGDLEQWYKERREELGGRPSDS